MRSLCSSALVQVAILAVLVACGTTPTARVPVRPDCLAGSQQCKAGWVVVEVDVAPSGSVDHAEVVEACPDQSFNWAAVDAVEKWKWKPSPEGKQDLRLRLCRP